MALTSPTKDKLQHIKVLKQLTAIINGEAPRVDGQQPPRVAAQQPRRVGNPTTSNDTTDPKVIRRAPRIHQRHTRNNAPIETIVEEEEAPRETNHPQTSDDWYAEPRKSVKQRKNTRQRKCSPHKESNPAEDSDFPGTKIPMPIFTIPLPKQRQPPRVPIVSQEKIHRHQWTVRSPSSDPCASIRPRPHSKCRITL